MNSSPPPIDPTADGAPDVLLVREGGASYSPGAESDPFAAWVDLMEVVEALCVRWPEPEVSPPGTLFRL